MKWHIIVSGETKLIKEKQMIKKNNPDKNRTYTKQEPRGKSTEIKSRWLCSEVFL